MADGNGKKEQKEKKKKKKRVRHLPQKRSINMAKADRKRIKWRVILPVAFGTAVFLLAFLKFGVLDQFIRAEEIEREVVAIQDTINQRRAEIGQNEGIRVRYAHYSTSGMTADELGRADRGEVLRLLETFVLPQMPEISWSLNGNTLMLTITGRTLQEINLMAQLLSEEKLVDYCTVTAAAYNGGVAQAVLDEAVNAKLVIYLNSGSKGAT